MITRKHSDGRLLKLADYLEQLPRGAIRMDAWLTDKRSDGLMPVERLSLVAQTEVSSTGRVKAKLNPAEPEKLQSCGFAACAVGWACTIPEFAEAGLKLAARPKYSKEYDVTMVPKYNDLKGFGAVGKFFGIGLDTVEYLFDANSFGSSATPRPSTVARRIRKVVERRRAGLSEVPDSWWGR